MMKLRLSAIALDKPVKVAVELPADVHRTMLARFMATDRAFAQSTLDPARLVAAPCRYGRRCRGRSGECRWSLFPSGSPESQPTRSGSRVGTGDRRGGASDLSVFQGDAREYQCRADYKTNLNKAACAFSRTVVRRSAADRSSPPSRNGRAVRARARQTGHSEACSSNFPRWCQCLCDSAGRSDERTEPILSRPA